ncbi:MAG: hypothetical protein EA361_19820 [Bacteroidetes bacterium]|nr:MAG: hypothetical protein EA361_19820 [Bacteroidota bacterium]
MPESFSAFYDFLFAKIMLKKLLVVVFVFIALSGCRSFYQSQRDFHQFFRQADFEQAQSVLSQDRRAEQRRTRLLFMLNNGVVHQLMGNYQESNEYFERAFITTEDFRQNPVDIAAALVANPRLTEYRGEDFELLMIHFYKAMNFIHLGDLDAALVECRRLNNRLNTIADENKRENTYRRDAFIHNLMGIIYEAAGDLNNAFIAYRNAYNIYSEDYSVLFDVEPPEQLKRDLLRSAYRLRFFDQLDFFQNKFGMQHTPQEQDHGDVVVFLKNGLGPVKAERSINFTVVRGVGGRVDFVNEELGLSFPFFTGDSQAATGQLGDLRVVRVAFPRFVERRPVYQGATVKSAGVSHSMEIAQDINGIAFQSLEDRMLRELGSALLRLAIKQTSEQLVRRENENVGAILSILNAITERADTRNWQTLPHSIHYTRISLPPGDHTLQMDLLRPGGSAGRVVDFQTRIRANRTTFFSYHAIESNDAPL